MGNSPRGSIYSGGVLLKMVIYYFCKSDVFDSNGDYRIIAESETSGNNDTDLSEYIVFEKQTRINDISKQSITSQGVVVENPDWEAPQEEQV